jgi:hypothetical protein
MSKKKKEFDRSNWPPPPTRPPPENRYVTQFGCMVFILPGLLLLGYYLCLR